MSTSSVILIFLLLYVVFLLQKSAHIAAEAERFAVITLGRFAGYRGPGLVVILPIVSRVFRLRIGDTGSLVGPELATFANVDVPVTGVNSIKVGSTIEITGFDEHGPVISLAVINRSTR